VRPTETQAQPRLWQAQVSPASPLVELARVLVRPDHGAGFLVKANHSNCPTLNYNFGVSRELVAACAACDGFGFVRNTAATAFDVFSWLQVTNFQVTNFGLLNSAPNRADYSDIRGLFLHCQLFRSDVRLGCSTDTLLASVLIANYIHSLRFVSSDGITRSTLPLESKMRISPDRKDARLFA
jgi:hypothetical protein